MCNLLFSNQTDDVPPLEDMSDAIEKIVTLRGQTGVNNAQKTQKQPVTSQTSLPVTMVKYKINK